MNRSFSYLISFLMVVGIVLNIGLMRANHEELAADLTESDLVDYGSKKMADWYDRHKVSATDKFAMTGAGQLAGLGNLGKSILASAGLVISPMETTVTINPGMRREEIAELLAVKLNWTPAEVAEFARLEPLCYVDKVEGEYLPGTYTLATYATPDEVADIMQVNFQQELDSMVALLDSNDPVVQTAIKVASLLQREAAGNGDERIIAGIIWNRLGVDMKLQLDATLQYAKGQPGNWWPVPTSEDKYLDSEYNTYQNAGLPPAPIANPSPEMILAALNPEVTDCLFYIHAKREFYCSPDYKGHLRNINRYL